MKFGLQINPYLSGPTNNPWDNIAGMATAADESGFDSVWLYDHFMWDDGTPNRPQPAPVLDCFVALGGLAAITKNVKLGQLVLGVPYRNPALVAKMASTLDIISHGRSILGLGAAWHVREFEGYGWDFGTLKERMERLEEATQVILKMWTERPASFQGKYYRLDRALNDPPTIQRPHPPIMIGGGGEKKTLRMVAQYAQWANVSGKPEEVAHKWDILRQHCTDLGRDYDEIVRSAFFWVVVGRDQAEVEEKKQRIGSIIPPFYGIAGTPDEIVDFIRAYERSGTQYCTIVTPEADNPDALRYLGQTVVQPLTTS